MRPIARYSTPCVDGRVPFSHVVKVIRIPGQTVVCGCRYLREAGIAPVVGQLASDRLDRSDWLLRLRVRSGGVG